MKLKIRIISVCSILVIILNVQFYAIATSSTIEENTVQTNVKVTDLIDTEPSDYVSTRSQFSQPANLTNNKWYCLKNAYSGKYLDVQGGGNAVGTNVAQWTYHGGNGQKWMISHTGNGLYKLLSAVGDRVLQVSSTSNSNGINVNLGTNANSTNKQFGISRAPSGAYAIFTQNSSFTKAIAIQSASCAIRANAIQWQYNSSYNDQWIFEPVDKNGTLGAAYAKTNGSAHRMPAYPNCDGIGGDCTNFVSQTMLASGLHQRSGWKMDRMNASYPKPSSTSQFNNSWSTDVWSSTERSPWVSAGSFNAYWTSTHGQWINPQNLRSEDLIKNPGKDYLMPYGAGDVVQLLSPNGNTWHSLYITGFIQDSVSRKYTYAVASHTSNYSSKPLIQVARDNKSSTMRFYDFAN